MRDAAALYLDWRNNFLTLGAFADHYEMSLETARAVIEEGRAKHDANAEALKKKESAQADKDRALLSDLGIYV